MDMLRSLPYLSYEVDVKTYKVTPSRHMQSMKVTKVISPHLFYLELEAEQPLDHHVDWRDAMQEFYESDDVVRIIKTDEKDLVPFRCYAYKDTYTGRWVRVRVLRLMGSHPVKAEVHLCDTSEFRLVDAGSLVELLPKFCTWASQGFPAHLIDVEPTDGKPFWSKRAVDEFKRLVQGKVFRTVVMCKSERPFPYCFPTEVQHFGVFMIQKTPESSNMTLQAELVKSGFAKCVGVCSSYIDMFVSSDETPYFSIYEMSMHKNDLICEEECQDDSDIQATVAKAIEKAESIRTNQIESELSILKRKFDFVFHSQKVMKNVPDEYLTFFCRGRLPVLKFSFVHSPSYAFIHLERQLRELQQLEAALQELCSQQRTLDTVEITAGDFIACLLQGVNVADEPPSWRRAIVKAVLPNKLLQLLLVDYGSEVTIKSELTSRLPKFFENIPGFVYRVFLDAKDIIPDRRRHWSEDSAEKFIKYVDDWETQSPVYVVYKTSGSVALQDLDQDIEYIAEENTWKPLPPPKPKIPNSAINAKKEHILLRKLFNPFGVDIQYELSNSESRPYGFKPMGEFLVEYGIALRRSGGQSLKDQHNTIVEFTFNPANMKVQQDILMG